MIEELGKRALNILREKYDIPKRGFLAGGALANVIWELVSGNKAVINDIDIFIINELSEKNSIRDISYGDLEFGEIYGGLSREDDSGVIRIINTVHVDGIINTIECESSDVDPNRLLDTFDLNVTKVGYSIEEDKFYYSDSFVEFLKTGKMLIDNVLSPCHVAIRLCSKSVDMNLEIDEFEFFIVKEALNTGSFYFKTSFMEKYLKAAIKHKDILDKHFHLKKKQPNRFLIQNDNDDIYYTLYPISDESMIKTEYKYTINSKSLLFFIRNVSRNPEKSFIWNELHPLYSNDDYLDIVPTEKDILLLSALRHSIPSIINNFKQLSISKQLNMANVLMHEHRHNPIVALMILMNTKFSDGFELSELNKLFLLLSVRKYLSNELVNKSLLEKFNECLKREISYPKNDYLCIK